MPKLTKRRVSEAQDLEESYRLADIVKQRQKTLDVLKLKAGELVLDIGCGVGFLTHEMALQVGKSGKVIGLDKNPAMISHSRKRCENLKQTVFYEGDAGKLPVDDQTLDAVSCTQVLLYIKDVPNVLAEMRRILKPGGRLVIVETDWRGVVLSCTDDILTSKIFSAWDSTVPSPNLPIHLSPLLKKYGFSQIQVEAVPILNTEYTPSNFSYDMMKWITKNAVKKGMCDEAQREILLKELEDRERTGSYFFCVNRFLFSAKV